MTVTLPDVAPRAGLAGWSLFAALIAMAGLPIYIHAPKFYVDTYGTSLAALGGVLALLRLIDVVQDPLLGWLAEVARAQRGLLVAIAACLMAIAMLGLFAVPPPVAPLLWFALTLTLLFSAFSFLTIAFYAEGVAKAAALGPQGHLRLAGWREGGSLAGVCVAAVAPVALAALLFIFPVVFLTLLLNSRFFTAPAKRNLYVGLVLVIGLWAYSGLAFNADPLGVWSMDPNMLNVFVSVVFVNSPGVFRIVRGMVMDIKTRDYVAAGQTRGEGPWYIMLWEILPNARGPLIVDFCLRIGYTTILLGTLGFFGLGVTPESPDWGSTINYGRRLLAIAPHPAVVPAFALMSLVLGLNLLADGLREESMKD